MTKRIGGHTLQVQSGCILICKKSKRRNTILFYFFLFGAIIFLIWKLIDHSPNAFKKKIDVPGFFVIFIFGLVLMFQMFFSVRRFIRVVSNFTLCKRGQSLEINGAPFSGENFQEIIITVQDVAATGVVGGSFTVGLSFGNKFYGLCYELSKTEADEIANFLASELKYTIQYRKAAFFPLFRLH